MAAAAAPETEGDLVAASTRALARAWHQTDRMLLGAPQPKAFDHQIWLEMARQGLLAARLPEAFGGADLKPSHTARIAHELGAAMVPEPYVACGVIPAVLCRTLPSGADRSRLVEALVGGRRRATLCWQSRTGCAAPEPGDLTIDDAGRIRGVGLFTPHAADAEILLVLAWREGAPILASVDPQLPAIHIDPHRLGDGGGAANLTFDDAQSSAVLLTGDAAMTAATGAITEAVLYTSAYLTGLADMVLGRALDHLRTRRQFGHPLGAFQTLQHQAVDLHMALSLAGASVRRAALTVEASGPSASAQACVSAAKARTAHTAVEICRAAVQICGGMGFAEEAKYGLALRIALQQGAWLGGPRVHLRRFGRLSGLAA